MPLLYFNACTVLCFFQLGGGLKPSGGLGMGMGGLGTSYGMGGKSQIHLIDDLF